MNWEDKAERLQELGILNIHMRYKGNWFCSISNVDIADGTFLIGKFGNGDSPISAIEDYWKVLTQLESGQYIVINALKRGRTVACWDGMGWIYGKDQ